MLINDLWELHGQLVKDDLIMPEGFKRAPVHLVVDLDADGEVRSVMQPEDERSHPANRIIPDLKRSSGIAPLLVADKLAYAAGLPARLDRAARAAAQHTSYQALLHTAIAELGPEASIGLRAVARATCDGPTFAQTLVEHGVDLDLRVFTDDIEATANSADREKFSAQAAWFVDFLFDGHPVLSPTPGPGSSGAAVEWWSARALGDFASTRAGQCQITGRQGPIARKLPSTKLMGTNPTLVSANFAAAERYSADQSTGAALSASVGVKATQALNWLVDTGAETHRWNLDDLILTWWCPDDIEWNPLNPLQHPDPLTVRRVTADSLWAGRPRVGSLSAFHCVLLKVNVARVVVLADHAGTLGELQQRLARWFEALAPVLANRPETHLGVRDLAAAACAPGKNRSAQRSRVADRLVRAALFGDRLPAALRSQVVARCAVGVTDRAGHRHHVTDAQAAVLFVIAKSWKETPLQGSTGECCGRLLAVLEITQQRALGTDLNRGVLASYGAAASTPQLVFPRLLAKRNAHAHRLRRDRPGTLRWLDGELERVMVTLGQAGGFPERLNPAGQADFALGYWDERYRLQSKPAAEVASESPNESTPPTTKKTEPNEIGADHD